jgi:hypothetical protein
MAKKHQHEEQELPFVALMDTMTNVVGVLIIVLVMVGLGVATTVTRVLSELPPVTEAELAALEKEIKEAPQIEAPEIIEKKKKDAQDIIKRLTEEIASNDLSKIPQNVKFMDLAEIQKKITSAKASRDAEKIKLDKLFAEVDRLKKALDDVPVFTPPPPKYVRIPNPRPLPEGAIREQFLIAKGRIIYLNEPQFLSAVMGEFEKNRKNFLKPGAPADKPVYVPAKVLEYFGRARIGDRSLAASVEQTAPTSAALFMKLVPSDTAGETLADIKNPASLFQRAVRKIKTEPNKVISLHVFNDSVETYLEARALADAVGVPVVWQITGIDYHRARLPGIVLDVPPPPPPDPNAPKSEIKPPKEQID